MKFIAKCKPAGSGRGFNYQNLSVNAKDIFEADKRLANLAKQSNLEVIEVYPA